MCAKCHRVDTVGRNYGPDLSNLLTMPRRDILRAIFFPSEKVDPKYATAVVVTKDGRTLRGLVLSETADKIVLKTATDPEPIALAKAQVTKRTAERSSIMPDDLADTVTDAGVRDVTAYIMRTVQ